MQGEEDGPKASSKHPMTQNKLYLILVHLSTDSRDKRKKIVNYAKKNQGFGGVKIKGFQQKRKLPG